MANQSSRPSLGQVAFIGTFYDARRDCFLSKSLFNGEPPAELLSNSSDRQTEVRICHGDSYGEKFKAMQVGPDLAASLLCGLVEPDGVGDYLTEINESRHKLQSSIFHTNISCQVKLDFSSPALKTYVTPSTVQTSEVTHVVAEIDYGAQSIVVLNHWRQEQVHTNREESQFHQRVEAFAESVKRQGTHAVGTSDEDFDHITVYSTVLGSGDIVLNGNVEARTFLELVPFQMKADGNGKGKPVSYRLLPVQMLVYLGLIKVEADVALTAPSQECMKKFVDVCDEFQKSKQPLEKHEVFATKYNFCLPPNHVDDVAQRVQRLRAAELDVKRDFASLLIEVRRGVTDPERLWQLIHHFTNGPQSPQSLSTFTENYQGKVAFVDAMMNKGALYIGYNGIDWRTQLNQRGDVDAYIFFFSEAAQQDPISWQANKAIMLQLLEMRLTNSFFAIVDCDATNENLERTYISQFQSGKIKIHDLREEQQYLADHCFARYQSQALETDGVQKPTKRRFAKTPCPGAKCSAGNICEWKCFQCRAPLEYGYSDQYVYCDCGRAVYSSYDFKCNLETHGPGFEKFDNQRLLQFLKSLDQSDYLNVLILGETGVGKSTFINAFVNYLYFETLDEALGAEDLHCVIPCSFATQTMDRSNVESDIVETEIKVGSRDDEQDGSKGASATQRTQVYPINVGKVTYRLIDTPGIGDTRGLQYDKSNMADILTTVSAYDELHGILILLKSNNARLTAHFSFCVKELLVHLHRDATENVVFGFTNTRISNYMPGDTFGSLKTLLEQRKDIGLTLSNKKTYCFDSESFRYLAAYKNGVILDNKSDFEGSWTKSRMEAERMLTFFKTRKPHPIKNTISLNGTRNLISQLTKPMAEISQLIKINIAALQDDTKFLQNARLTGDELKARLHPEKQLLKTKPLDKPRTVCSDSGCIEYKDNGAGTMLNNYPNPCHPVCHLKGVEVDVHSHPQLIHCYAFRGNQNCQECGHHWNIHLHILYEVESYTSKVKDVGIEEQIRKHASDISLKQAVIRNREIRMKEYATEHTEIRQAAAKFGLWMRANSIMAYNDATLAYLEILINDEQAKADAGGIGNRKRVEQLKEDVQKHKELVSILEASMKTSGKTAPINQNEVQGLVTKLFSLKHFGANLEHLKLGITESHERTNRELPHRVKIRNINANRHSSGPSMMTTLRPVQGHQKVHPQPQRQNTAPYTQHQMQSAFASATMRNQPQHGQYQTPPMQVGPTTSFEPMPGAFSSMEETPAHMVVTRQSSYKLPIIRAAPKQSKRTSILSSINPFK